MAKTDIKAIRAKFPQYADLSDKELADGIHRKFYSDKMGAGEFYRRIGYGEGEEPEGPKSPGEAVSGAPESPGREADGIIASLTGRTANDTASTAGPGSTSPMSAPQKPADVTQALVAALGGTDAIPPESRSARAMAASPPGSVPMRKPVPEDISAAPPGVAPPRQKPPPQINEEQPPPPDQPFSSFADMTNDDLLMALGGQPAPPPAPDPMFGGVADAFRMGDATAVVQGQDFGRDISAALEEGVVGRTFYKMRKAVGIETDTPEQRAEAIRNAPRGAVYESSKDQLDELAEKGFNVTSWSDVDGLRSGVRFVAENLSTSLPQMATALASGALAPVSQTILLGAEANEELKERTDLPEAQRVAIASGAGVAMWALETIGLGKIFGGMLPGEFAKRAANGTLAKLLTSAGLPGFAARILEAGVFEGSTEAIQDGIIMAVTALGGGRYTADEVKDRLSQAFIAGGAVGSSLRGAVEPFSGRGGEDEGKPATKPPAKPKGASPYRPVTPIQPKPEEAPADPLVAAMSPDAPVDRAPPPPPAAPVDVGEPPVDQQQEPLTSADASQAPTPTPTSPPLPSPTPTPTPAPPEADGRYEILDEVENIDGSPDERRPTGRKIRIDRETGQVSVVETEEAAGSSPAGAPTVGRSESQPQEQQEQRSGAGQVDAESPAADGLPPPERKFLTHDETLAIETDPKTFQYKGGADTEGVTNALQGVRKYDPNRAGQIVIFEKKDGRRIVADGHQRTGLARRMAADGQKDVGGTAAVIYREADGYTADQVMNMAAMKNIGEGSGTAVDAARILRIRTETVEDLGLPPRSALVRTAEGLRHLSDDAFGMVVNDKASERDGAIVGRVVENKKAQTGILGLLTKANPPNAFQAESIARQAAQDVTTETQTSLFGDEEVATNLYVERAKILDNAVKRLGNDTRLFGTLTEKEKDITSAGNVLDADENTKRLDEARRTRDHVLSQANMKGPISDALSEAARQLKAGATVASATESFLGSLKRGHEVGGPGGQAPARGRQGNQESDDGGSQQEERLGPQDGQDDLLAALGAAPPPKSPASKPNPAPEEEGGLLAALGAKPAKNPEPKAKAKAEAEVVAKQSKIRKGGEQAAAGPLFDDQTDIEDAAQKPAAKPVEKPAEKDTPSGLIDRGKAITRAYSRPGDEPPDSVEFADLTGGPDGSPSPEAIDLAQRLLRQSTPEGRQKAATEWVLENGKTTGREHLVILDADGVPLSITRGTKASVSVMPSAIRAAIDGKAAFSVHNHPTSKGPSPRDLTMLGGWPGHHMRIAAHNGETFDITATDRLNRKVEDSETEAGLKADFDKAVVPLSDIFEAVRTDINAQAIEIGRQENMEDHGEAVFNGALRYAYAVALDRAGLINYAGAEAAAAKAEARTGINFEVINGRIASLVDNGYGRARPAVSQEGNTGGNQPPGSRSEAAPQGSVQTDQGSESDGRTGDGEGRLPPRTVTDEDIDAAFAAATGQTTPNAKPKSRRSDADLAKDIGNLFKEPGAEFQAAGLDEAKYRAAVPLFKEALEGVDVLNTPLVDVFTAMIRPLQAAGLPESAIKKMGPYFKQFYRDVESGKIQIDRNGGSDEAGTDSNLERDRGELPASDAVGATGVPPAGRGNEDSAGPGRGTPEEGNGIVPGSDILPSDDAASVGAGRDTAVQGGPGADRQPAVSGDGSTGSDAGNPRIPPDDSPAAATGRIAQNPAGLTDRKAAQREADRIAEKGIKRADENNIRETLPLLLHEQQDDVLKIERRFEKPDGHGMLLTNGTGTGKAQPLDARILTPNGWRLMGEISPGDMVIAADGKPTQVLSVHPQGEKPIFRVEFSDGAATECCDDHLWETQTLHERRKSRAVPKVRPLSEIRQSLDAQHFVPVPAAIEHPARPLPVHPYTLGGILGDGPDDTLIPDDYLLSSIENRICLLQGLMDTDGKVDRRTGSVSFRTSSSALADGLVALVRSLGGIAIRNDQPAHKVTLHLPDGISPFWRSEKAAFVRPKKHAPRRKIVAVTEVGRKPAQCIAVSDARHLYVTDDYVLTHNTYSGGGAIKRSVQDGKSNILIVAPSQGILSHWKEALADLGVEASILPDTKTAGSGVVLTTYSAMGANTTLAARKWDMVVGDESHELSSNADGKPTAGLRTLRAITNRPDDLEARSDMIHADEWTKLHAMKDGPEKSAYAKKLFDQRKVEAEKFAKEPRPKVLFLSATPFAYEKSVDYAEGYLFNYPEGGWIGRSRQPGRNIFMVQNFGYRIRYHKLTEPDSNVDRGVFAREFHQKLRGDGVLSGRHLDIEPDYQRAFIQREDAKGSQIDDIMSFVREKAHEKGPDAESYQAYLRAVRRKFNYLRRMQLLEAIKANNVQADIDRHLAAGRKIVIFHDFNIGGGFNPFRPFDDVNPDAGILAPESAAGQDDIFSDKAKAGYDLLVKARPEVAKLNFAGYLPPVQAIKKIYGDRAVIYNGTMSTKERAKAKTDFNKDGSGVDIMIVQSQAGSSGISLHDTTGKHQRVMINLGMPTRPTTALQEEGRIRREGSVSDAMFHYYTIGTTWEREAFANRIATKSDIVENLALGDEARAIRNRFIESYEEAAPWSPSETDGKGGKEGDRSRALQSTFDIAKSHYFGRMKTSGKRTEREGADFYATPEPVGLKMVEWANIRPYERSLEPSAGDGAIARYLPETSDRTIIDPSADLLSRAELRAVGAKAINDDFENHHITNKYNAIVMNPPFGSGGKTAVEHLRKAMGHLRPGGRIVALIPTGPMADKRFDALYGDDAAFADFDLVTEIPLPSVTFEKAGTSVATKIVIIDKRMPGAAPVTPETDNSLAGARSVEDLFDRIENMRAPDRNLTREQTEEQIAQIDDAQSDPISPAAHPGKPMYDANGFKLAEVKHGKTGADVFVATSRSYVPKDTFSATLAVAKRHGGHYSKYDRGTAVPGYQFPTKEARQAFLDDVTKPVIGMSEPSQMFVAPDEPDSSGYTPEQLAWIDETTQRAMPKLRADLDRINLKRVQLIHSRPMVDERFPGAQGMFLPGTNEYAEAIVIGTTLDRTGTLNHEVIHALKSMNLFTPVEWRALTIKAARTWVKKYNVEEVWAETDPTPLQIIEEAIAEAFADYSVNDKAVTGSILVRAFTKMQRFIKAIKSWLDGEGYTTTDIVFNRIMAGKVGGRTGTPALSNSSAFARAARLPSRQARAHMATAMGGSAFIPDRRIWEELTRANTPVWERIGEGAAAAHDAVDKARVKIQDRFLPVLRAEEAVMRQTGKPLPEEQHAYGAEETFSGKVGRHLFKIDEDYVKPIISLLAKTKGDLTVDDVGQWLTARHAVERNAHIASINPRMPDGGSGMTNADARAILSQAAAGPHNATLLEIGRMVDALRNRSIDLRENAGLLSPADAHTWRTQYKFYVPLKGFAETDQSEAVLDVTGVGRRFNTRGPESKRALGRQSEAFNPLQSAITQAQEVAIRAEKNRVGAALHELAENNPAPALWEVKKVKTKRVYNRSTGLVETRPENPVSLFMEPNEIAVKRGGKEYRILFKDPRLARAAGSVGADQMGWFMSMMSVFGRYFSSINTMLDPQFTIRNAFRDMTAAQITMRNFGKDDRNAIAAAMIRDWPKAFAGAFRGMDNKEDSEWTRYWREFEESGAKVSFWKLEQPEAGKADLEKRIRLAGGSRFGPVSRFVRFSTRDNPVLGFVERTNLAVDNAIRLAAFVAARKRGWTKQEAASLSKNMTVNFNRRGEWGATINALYPFANASIQGSQILFRALSSKRMAKYLVGMVVLSVILDAVNASFSAVDDDGELAYDKIPDFKNRTNMFIMLGPKSEEAFSIWMPYGFSVFPYVGQQIGKVYRGVKKPDEAMRDVAGAIFNSFSPINGEGVSAMLTPTVLDPISEMTMNEDWLGRPIRPEYPRDYGPDAYKYYGGVSEISKQLADIANRATGGNTAESGLIDVSPEYIDHAFGFLTGGMGRTLGQTIDLAAKAGTGNLAEIEDRDIPIYRNLIQSTGDWLDRDRYYKFREEVNEAKKAANAYRDAERPVPRHIRLLEGLAPDLKKAEKARKSNKGDEKAQAKIFLQFNKLFIKTMGPQGE